MHIPFNKPSISGNETAYIQQAVESEKFPAMGCLQKNVINSSKKNSVLRKPY